MSRFAKKRRVLAQAASTERSILLDVLAVATYSCSITLIDLTILSSVEDMASSAHHYEPPRLPTFQERRRAKELQQASKQQDTSTSPINRWAVRDPRTPPLRDSPSVPAIVLPGPGVALSPDILARGQSQGPTLGRKPLPQPLPGRGRMQSQSPHMVPFSPNMAINPMQSCQPPLPPPIITALSTLSLGAAPSPPMSPMSPIPPPIPSSSRPLPQPTSFRPHPSPQSSYQTSPHPFLIQHTPHTPASALADHTPTFDPFMARSDTLTSIKSLDRVDMTPQGTRPLPRPPVGVGPSKSLDRGMGDGNTGAGAGDGEASAFQARRRLAKRSSRSTIIEEERSTSSSHGAEGSGFILESAPLIVVVPHISFGNDEEEDTVSATSANSAALAESIPSSNIPSFSLPDIPTISLPTFSFSADDDNDGDTKEPNSPPSIPTIEETLPKRLTHQTSQSGPGLFCAACDNVILGRVLTAMECRWHPDCFRCEACGMLLEHVSSYENGGKAYCHMDYHEVSFGESAECR